MFFKLLESIITRAALGMAAFLGIILLLVLLGGLLNGQWWAFASVMTLTIPAIFAWVFLRP